MSKSHIQSNLILDDSLVGVDDSMVAYFPFKYTANDSISETSPAVNNNNTLTGEGIAVEEATTNLITNGNFSNGFAGWSIGGPNIDMKANPIMFEGKTCLYLELGIWNVNGYALTTFTLAANTTYTVSFLVYRISGQMNFDPNGTWNVNYSLTPESNKWIKYVYTFTTDAAGGGGSLNFHSNSRGIFYLTDVQLEQKSFPTSFVNGSRAAGSLRYSFANIRPLTISFWHKPSMPLSSQINQATSPNIFEIGDYHTNDSLTLWCWTGDIKIYIRANSTGWTNVISSTTLTNDQWMEDKQFTLVLDGTNEWSKCDLYINGIIKSSTTLATPIRTIYGSFFGMGTYGGAYPNATYRDLMIYERILTDDEIYQLYLNDGGFYISNEEVML